MLAQLLAGAQVLAGGVEVVALEQHAAHADVHVGRAAEHGRALRRRHPQAPLVAGHRLAETALGDRGCRPGRWCTRACRRGARPSPGSPWPRSTTGAPARGRRSPSARARAARPPLPARAGRRRRAGRARAGRGVDGAGHVPAHPRLRGAVDGDLPPDSADAGRPRRRPWTAVLPRGSGAVQPALGVAQPGLDAVELAVHEEGARVRQAQHRPGAEHLVGEGLEPAAQRGLLPRPGAGPAGPARRGPPPARSRRRPARGGSPRPARRCARTSRSPAGAGRGPRRAARRAGGRAARRRRGGGSGTTGGDRRAGPGTGSPAPEPPASPCRRR